MCRNITELRGLEPPATREEIEAAARQFVRKVSGVTKPKGDVAAAMEDAALRIAHITEHLLADLPAAPAAAEVGPAAAPARGTGPTRPRTVRGRQFLSRPGARRSRAPPGPTTPARWRERGGSAHT